TEASHPQPIFDGAIENAEKTNALSGREFDAQNLDPRDVNRDQNNSQHEHARSKSPGDQRPEVERHASRGVNEATSELGAENRNDAQQGQAKELEETAKINPKSFGQNIFR